MSSIYQNFCAKNNYSEELQDCIISTVNKLLKNDTSVQKPGMLLGKIQSGKTRAFIGIIALCFDKNYDIAVILTKGTKVLAKQTYERLFAEFENFIDDDRVQVYDIMNMQSELTPYIRNQKLIIVAKKETRNLDKLVDFFTKYSDLKSKNLLIIDDEADYASVGFKKDKKQIDEISMNVLARKIDAIRNYGVKTDFLQVTATPYSLYLQPETFFLNGEEYKPVRPVFTSLVPIHDKYIGSEFYFECSEDPASPAFHLFIDVPDKELSVLRKPDQRYISNILTTPNLAVFRQAVITLITAGIIRRLQEYPRNYKCSCIIHTETGKPLHQWQADLAESLIQRFRDKADHDTPFFSNEIKKSYNNLANSIPVSDMPALSEVIESVRQALRDGYIGIYKINSEAQIEALIDKKAQLRLDNPINIFIGGQILDRGITVENMICFFYGRNPNKFQQDTVMQHSRMYGARSERDMNVTRFYTSPRIYNAMKRMHQLDSALRESFESGQHGDDGVVFLETDQSGEVKPCAPNKIIISSTETIKAYRRFLPRGMQTVSRTKMNKIHIQINSILNNYSYEYGKPFLMNWEDMADIFRLIRNSYEFNKKWDNVHYEWSPSSFIAIMRRLCVGNKDFQDGRLFCVIKKNRNSSRVKGYGAFNDAPDDGQSDRPEAKKIAEWKPVVQLFIENGYEKQGWRDVPFWWPVLVCPKNTKVSVFTSETKNNHDK
ncbi:MAG: hypothetical protein JXR73_13650 [Candidatus Omnitrophica bacterium]|nr:hypothetical protein [Candidatus Omnitrophota bacterium]